MAANKISEGSVILADFENLNANSENCPPPSCDCSNSLRRTVWAYKFADILSLARRFRDPVVLAVEYRQQGSRLFVATSRKHVFHFLCHIRIQRPQYRTWHEIFSNLTPLRLYFDLDFYFETNRTVNPYDLLRDFCQLISTLLKDHFRWQHGEERNLRFVNLDATTAEKFSRHIIVHMADAENAEIVFDNPMEIRCLIHKKVMPALKNRGFIVQPKPGVRSDDQCLLIDLSVYGEKGGQNFRLLGSPKYGRDNVLRFLPTGLRDNDSQHEFSFHDSLCPHCERIFTDGLVTASNIPRNQNQSAQPLISVKNLEIYRRETTPADMIDVDEFGGKCAFYCEIHHFITLSKLFNARYAKNLVNGIATASMRSEYFETLPSVSDMLKCVELYKKFKTTLGVDSIDWDIVYNVAADLLDFFELDRTSDSEERSEELCDDPAIDPITRRRLGILYSKFSRWKNQSGNMFFTKDFDKAKKLYDSYLQVLMSSRKSTVPDDLPLTLTMDNFPSVYTLLEATRNSELDRRRQKKEMSEMRLILKLELLRSRLEEEKEFCGRMQKILDERMRTQQRIPENINRRGIEFAISHSSHLIKDFTDRINVWERGDTGTSAGCSTFLEESPKVSSDSSLLNGIGKPAF